MIKFPRIPYGNYNSISRFEEEPIKITEKLDGLNVCLYNGQAYRGKDNSQNPCNAGYMAMVKKHHAHKTRGETDLMFFGEDLYAQHACAYDPIEEGNTFRVFMIISQDGYVLSWNETVLISKNFNLCCVPSLFGGSFGDARTFERKICNAMLKKPSVLGGEREGIVVRRPFSFPSNEMHIHTFKIVRPEHVQPNANHWSKNWKPREIIWEK